MSSFRLLIFSDHRLVSSEEIEAADAIAAIRSCSERHRYERIEIWSDEGRIATLGSVSIHDARR